MKPVYKKHKRASAAVEVATAFFISREFQVFGVNRSVCANGPDLTIAKNGRAFRVEVKAAFHSKRAMKVSPLKRADDDFVAIVFPSGAVHIEAAKDYRAHCSKDKSRCVSMLGFIYD